MERHKPTPKTSVREQDDLHVIITGSSQNPRHQKHTAAASHPEVKKERTTMKQVRAMENVPWMSRKCPTKKPRSPTKREMEIAKFKNLHISNQYSDATLTVQTLEFPDVNVKRTEIGTRDDCGKRVFKAKGETKDFLSSSDSGLRDAVVTVNMRKKSCPSSSLQKFVASNKSSSLTSTIVEDNFHTENAPSVNAKNFRGDVWKRPCSASDEPGSPAGLGLKSYQQLAKLSPARKKFFLTQDPRKTPGMPNVTALRQKKLTQGQQFQLISKMVKHGENVCASTGSESSASHICEVIDLENPVNLDFQGMDYKNTYEKDEQDQQNQQSYWRVVRYMARRHTKKTLEKKVEAELQAERIAIPPVFRTKIKDEPLPEEPPQKPHKLAQLFRTQEKPANKHIIALEEQRRAARYKNIYLKNKEAKAVKELERNEKEAAAKEIIARAVAEMDLKADVAKIDDDLERSFRKFEYIPLVVPKRKFFPKTLKETERLKTIMHKENCVRRDQAKVTQEFYEERTGKLKKFPDAAQQLRCKESIQGSVGSTPSEQSSDDEDYLKVGKIGDQFQLRGFHFKHGDGLRGKLHRHQIMEGQRTVKGCLTREEWLNQLAPRKEPIKLDVERGIIKVQDPDDPELDLFPPKAKIMDRRQAKSAIKEFIGMRLGQQYHRVLRKNVKLVKPKLKYQVKKFNLIRYVFPEKIIVPKAQDLLDADAVDANKADTTVEYVALKERAEKARKHKLMLARMNLLGLPCVDTKKLHEQSPCNIKEEDYDLDWVPSVEMIRASTSGDSEPRLAAGETRIPIEKRGNMPAPMLREKTLHIHPRRQRDYDAERVPSSQFNDFILTSGMPLLEKIAPDTIKFENVRTPKRLYTEGLEARHHHDHWDPTQVKRVNVHYQPRMVHPEITVQVQPEKKPIVNFQKANPPCKKYLDTDLTLPRHDFDKMIANHLANTRIDSKEGARTVVNDLCDPHDVVFHSRNPEELTTLDFSGRREYLDFLRETREALYETKDIDPSEEHLLVDRQQVIAELEEDLKSIEQCLTSMSSSECTNLSRDSGSFLLLEDNTKIPLDYVRKPLVPFEEMRRCRFEAELIDIEGEEQNPYHVLPFSGQHKEQATMLSPKDSFFTFNSRLRNTLRLRLEVPVVDVRKVLFGTGSKKYSGSVITDLDENYIKELKNRATVKKFKFKTGMLLMKFAMRYKYESLLIQEKTVRTRIYDSLNDRHWQDMINTQKLYEGLFARWQKMEYTAAMTQVYQVKNYYEITDSLKREYRELERELTMLNMDIVFIEGHLIRCVMLQNFHYLLGEEEWRLKHDWIHLVPVVKRGQKPDASLQTLDNAENIEYELERYDESIAKRSTVNIRVRDKDDAWAIRHFYYEVFSNNPHPVLQVFPNAEAFFKGIDELKSKTAMQLLEMHLTMAIHTEVQGKVENFEDWCNKDLKEREEYVARKSAKKFFMENRAAEMEERVRQALDIPIHESVADEDYIKHRGILAELWRRIVPGSVRGTSDVVPSGSDMVASISNVVLDILSRFEHLDAQKTREVETAFRKRRRYLEKQSAQAYQVEKRIDTDMKKVRRNLQPPFTRPKRTEPLQRLHLKKRVKKVVPPPVIISENTRNFVRAFADDGVVSEGFTQDAVLLLDNIQEQIVPFYFDHFLKLNGYMPNYNFQTNIMMRDGPEIDRFRFKEVIPEVVQKVDKWEATQKKIMEDNIQRNPKMYENIR